MMLKVFISCTIIATAYGYLCYDKKCENYDGSYISCDLSKNKCTKGTFFFPDATCTYTGWGDSYHSIICFDSDECYYDSYTGKAMCGSDFIEAGLNLLTIIIIVILVIIVLGIVSCCVCCYFCGKCCFKNRRQRGQVINLQSVANTGPVAYNQASGNIQPSYPNSSYPPGAYPAAQYPPGQYPQQGQYPPPQYPPAQYPPAQYPPSHPPEQYPPVGGYSPYPGEPAYSPESQQGAYPPALPPPYKS